MVINIKISEKIKDNKFFFVIFGVLTLSSVFYLTDREFTNIVSSYYTPLYAANYDCGFSSRLFIGSVFSLFFKDKISLSAITATLLVVYYIVCFLLSLLINNYLKKSDIKKPVGVYITFLVLSPVFVAMLKYLGTTDVFLLLFLIASFFVIDKKYLRWLLPVFCIIALATHEFFAVMYLPVIAFAVFEQFAKKPDKTNLIYLIFCALTCGAGAVYFLIFGRETMAMSSSEMIDFVKSRLDLQGGEFPDFYIRGAYFWEGEEATLNYQRNLLGYVQYAFDEFVSKNYKEIALALISNFLSAAPLMFVLTKAVRYEKNTMQKLGLVCAFAVPFISTFLLFMSTDVARHSQHFIVNVIFIILFLVKEQNTAFRYSLDGLMQKISSRKLLCGAVGVLILLTVFSGVLIWIN